MYSLLVKQVKYQPSHLKVNVFSTGQAGKIPTISKSMYSLLVKQVKYQPSHLKVNVFSTGQAGKIPTI